MRQRDNTGHAATARLVTMLQVSATIVVCAAWPPLALGALALTPWFARRRRRALRTALVRDYLRRGTR